MKKEVKRRPRRNYTQEEVDNFILEEDYPTSKLFKNLSGSLFGKWEVLKYCGKEGSTQPKYFCLCTGCSEGNIQKVYGHHLRKGITTSCGCEHRSVVKETASVNNRQPFEHHSKLVEDFNSKWTLTKVLRQPYLGYEVSCSSCNKDFYISNSSLYLRSGGCKCTTLNSKGFDYNTPAWFYLFKISGETGDDYWKYGVTQKQNIEERNFSLTEGYSRELVFYTAIRDRWDTIGLERDFQQMFQSKGLTHTKKGSVCKSGWTECYPNTLNIPSEKLISFFWSLEPKVIPFHTDKLRDITTTKNNSLSSGVVKFFNLDREERSKYYTWCSKQNILPDKINLLNPLEFNKISEYINKIRGG